MAIFVDSRDLAAYAASVTRVPGIGLVMRCNTTAGYLPELFAGKESLEFPLIISTRGNTETTGFVKVEGGRSHREYVVGINGFPFQANPDVFRALPTPMEVIVVPAGTRIEKIKTKGTITARTAFQTIESRSGNQKSSVVITAGGNMLVQGWEIFLPAGDEDMPYFADERQKTIFSVENMVNAALRLHAKRLDEDPVGGNGQHFIKLNEIIADEAVGNFSWKEKFLPAYTRKLAGNDGETIVSRLAQRMREEGWSLTIDTADQTLPLQAVSPDGIVVATGPRLSNIKDRSLWKEILVGLCDGLGFDAQQQLLSQISPQKAVA